LASASALTNCIDQYSIGAVSGAIMNARKAVKAASARLFVNGSSTERLARRGAGEGGEQTQDLVNLPPAPRAALVPQ
jgi:hypothetical protein